MHLLSLLALVISLVICTSSVGMGQNRRPGKRETWIPRKAPIGKRGGLRSAGTDSLKRREEFGFGYGFDGGGKREESCCWGFGGRRKREETGSGSYDRDNMI